MRESLRTVLANPPIAEPVTLEQVRRQLRILDQESDDLIKTLIPTARKTAEQFLGRALIEQQYHGYVSRFYPVLIVPHPPLISVESIEYTDPDGNVQTADPSLYIVDTISEPGMILLAQGKAWPDTSWDPNAVKVTYKAGYGPDPYDIPQPISQAVVMLVGTMFDNPTLTGSSEENETVDRIFGSLLAMNRNMIR